jgi:Glycine zipper
MKKLSSIMLALTLATAVSGCTTTEQGATAGAVGGALIGAGIGAVAGGLIGHSMEHRGYCRYQRRNGTIYEARC